MKRAAVQPCVQPERRRGRPLARSAASLVASALTLASGAWAGGRAHYGGTLRVAAVAKAPETDPLLADTPIDATLLSLTALPPCRLGELSRPSPGTVRLSPAPNVKADTIAKSLEAVRRSASPYAALLAGVKTVSVVGGNVELQLSNPLTELERVLCHPALAAPIGPFKQQPQGLAANSQIPDGRPYLDSVLTTPTDARTAERLLLQRRVHLVLGTGSGDDGAQLHATYLLAAPGRAELSQAVDFAVERKDLTRFFVRAPASPLYGLLPPGLGAPAAQVTTPAKPAATKQDVTLLYDSSLEDQKAVAERIQVKLQPLGFRVALQAVTRRELRERWHSKQYEMMLMGVLLPAVPEGAYALVLQLANQPELAAATVTATDSAARDKAWRDAALSLQQPGLPVVPLYVQGLAVTASKDVLHLSRDAQGLARLDDAFLSAE